MIKVIGGHYKGRKLVVPDTNTIRPTSNRMRESLFNKLMHAAWRDGFDLNNARVLDLFCGSGALGIEAVSRGAAHCTFVDADITSIQSNASMLDNNAYNIIKAHLPDGLHIDTQPFDLILMDPPYDKGLINPMIDHLIHHKYICDHGLMIVEGEQGIKIENPNVIMIDHIKQATSQIDILGYKTTV